MEYKIHLYIFNYQFKCLVELVKLNMIDIIIFFNEISQVWIQIVPILNYCDSISMNISTSWGPAII